MDSQSQTIESKTEQAVESTSPEVAALLDGVLSGKAGPVSAENENDNYSNSKISQKTEVEISPKAQTRTQLIKRVRELYKMSGQHPVIDGKKETNFARLRKAQLLKCVAFYCENMSPFKTSACQNTGSTHSEMQECFSGDFQQNTGEQPTGTKTFHEDLVSSVLYRGNLTLLQFLEKASQSETVKRWTGGLQFSGMIERVESDLQTQVALKEALFAVYLEYPQLEQFISPTARLCFINMQIMFASAQKSPPKSQKITDKEKCKDKTPLEKSQAQS